jgi:hypothetical protein
MNLETKVLLTKSKEVIFNLFEDIVRFNDGIGVKEFFDVFMHIANVVKVSNVPLSLDAVKIVDASNSMEIFKEFYVVGVSYENAPNLKFDCGIILDNEIEKLNFANKLSPTIAHINKLAKLRLFNLLTLFEDELTLTYSTSQSDVVKDLLNKIQVETATGVINIEPISKFNFTEHVALSKWDYVEYLCKNNLLKNSKNSEKIIKNKEIINISNKNLNIFDNFNNISATTLENYFKCPMMAFSLALYLSRKSFAPEKAI